MLEDLFEEEVLEIEILPKPGFWKFSGEEDVEAFLQQFEDAGVGETEMPASIKPYVAAVAREWLSCVWEDSKEKRLYIKLEMIKRFKLTPPAEQYRFAEFLKKGRG